jgi:hypothetical protein
MENLNDLFNLKADDLVQKSESKTTDIYKPTADKGKEGVYSAVVRFLPWHENPKKSIMKKWTCWLVDPLTDKGKYVDCPSSAGEKSVLQDMYWKLKKSDSVAEQNLSQNFSRRQSMAALVQIVKDDNNPGLVGKVMVWPFGVKIYNKIQEQMQPEFGTPHIPFDLFEGKPFHIKVTKVAGYNNYDNCRFLDNPHLLKIEDKEMDKTPENMTTIVNFLKEASPNLAKYDFQPWDTDMAAYVNNVIANTVPGGRIAEGVMKTNSAQIPSAAPAVVSDPLAAAPAAVAEAVSTTTLPNLDSTPGADLNLDDANFDDDLYADL